MWPCVAIVLNLSGPSWSVRTLCRKKSRVFRLLVQQGLHETVVVEGTAVGQHKAQDLQVATVHGCSEGFPVPRAAAGSSPPEDVQVAACGGCATNGLVPGAPVGSRPLDDLEVTARGGHVAHVFVPEALVGPGPLQNVQVTAAGGRVADILLLPERSGRTEPLQDVDVTVPGGFNAGARQLVVVRAQVVEDRDASLSGRDGGWFISNMVLVLFKNPFSNMSEGRFQIRLFQKDQFLAGKSVFFQKRLFFK